MKTWIRIAVICGITTVAGCGSNADTAKLESKTAAMLVQGGARMMDATQPTEIKIAGYRANYTISKVQDIGIVTVTNQITNEVQTYQNPTLIKFVDTYTSFDINGPAGQVYRLYQAAFNRKPDLPGLGFWIAANQNGRSVLAIASDFIVSAEFKALYGDNVPNTTFINTLYQNILSRSGEPAGVAWWVGQMNGGATANGVLFGFSDSAENKDNLAAAIQNGFDYVPFNQGGPIIPKSTSYSNAKMMNLERITLPKAAANPTAYAQADFFQNGTLGLFTAQLRYTTAKPISEALPGSFVFWRKTPDGRYEQDPSMILDEQTGCIHPRKAIVADFNSDGKPDILVACHGYDAYPFPGEHMVILTSTPTGKYHYREMREFLGFFHAAAAADLNADGTVDFVVTDTKHPESIRMMLNNGDGAFTEKTGQFPTAMLHRGYFSVELTDVDGDGKVDLLVGGHEWEGDSKTMMIAGSGHTDFSAGLATVIPPVPGQGVVLDFIVTKKGLIVNRTSGGGTTFYQSKVVQLVDLSTLSSRLVYSETAGDWVPWLLPTATGVSSADTNRNLDAVF